MQDNGLDTFSVHSGQHRATMESFDASPAAVSVDPETAARHYLESAVASPAAGVDLKVIGTETVALTGTTVVKFAQYRNRIPVYGSLVTVELGDDNALLAISGALGGGAEDPVATVSPARARATIAGDAGPDAVLPADPPRLYHYFDGRWRLAYISTDVLRRDAATRSPVPERVDYVVDAHTGDLVARLPRTQSAGWTVEEASHADGLGARRVVRLETDGAGNRRLIDPLHNVHTHDFGFHDVDAEEGLLPGAVVVNPPEPWSAAAISAHANAIRVAEFLSTVLKRRGLDNRGGPIIASINCTMQPNGPGDREWRNAAWIGTQMIYGQRTVDGALRSYALAADVVAHEIFHGVTEKTARLEYRGETGALNESYSDIFGVVISNTDRASVDDWNWELGEDLLPSGVPLRDLGDPARRGQPAHMKDFRRLEPGTVASDLNDYGWVHHNSGIHNKAAYNLVAARVIEPTDVAALFYLALTQYLSRTSGFGDSRRGVTLAARTLFRADPGPERAAKLAAVAAAFDAVGITV